jgi:hypothetical protein
MDGCDKSAQAKGLCMTHYQRQRRNGDPNLVRPRGYAASWPPTYRRVHHWLRRERGKASDYTCIECGGQARDWAYDNCDPDELVGLVAGTKVGYSADLSRYYPMCHSCHLAMDRSPDGRFRGKLGALKDN